MSEGSATLAVDIHEPTRLTLLALDHPDVDGVTEHALDAADIVVNGIGFERKTPADFAASLTEGRLDAQAEKLADAYDHAYVLIEGGFEGFEALDHSRLNPQSARGKAASLTARDGIPVIPCGAADSDRKRSARLLDHAIRLGRKHTEEPTSTHLPTGDIGSDEPPGLRMWACVPGVGPARAETLHDALGSPTEATAEHGAAPRERAVEELEERIRSLDGFGEKTAETIAETLL